MPHYFLTIVFLITVTSQYLHIHTLIKARKKMSYQQLNEDHELTQGGVYSTVLD